MEKANKQTFKVRAYEKVIKQIEAHKHEIKTLADFKNAGFKGVGKGILEKVEQIFETGVIQKVEEGRALMDAVKVLTTVHGIGPAKATELYNEYGISTIEVLETRKELLNNVQLKGLRYHADCAKRIPRAEMDKHDAMLKSIIKVPFNIAGSYRRNEPTSGDIDVIICSDDADMFGKVVEKLRQNKYVCETLAQGEKKFMGVCKLPRFRTFRRIDIMVVDTKRYPFALLYFTGSKTFNVKMRSQALKRGYSLNEFGFTPAAPPGTVFKTERDIFDFLEFKYVEPRFRS